MNTLDQLATTSAANAQAAKSAADTQMLADDFDTFLQLLTTQLRNQDPLEPMDTNQFTQQLVQFSGVEQQIRSNSYLETLIASTKAQAVNAVVGYLGSTVKAQGTTTNLTDGGASWHLTSPVSAEGSTLSISDQNGREVFSRPYAVSAGESLFTWDGRMSNNQMAPDGMYSLLVRGNTANGDPVDINTAISGKVTGIDVTGDQPVLRLGEVEVNMSAVQSVTAQ